MVAIQATTGAALAVLANNQAIRLPQLASDPQTDAAIKALIGIGLVVASVWVKNGWIKTVLIGTGVGVTMATATIYLGR
jgi:hypothetical protein